MKIKFEIPEYQFGPFSSPCKEKMEECRLFWGSAKQDLILAGVYRQIEQPIKRNILDFTHCSLKENILQNNITVAFIETDMYRGIKQIISYNNIMSGY